MSEQPELPTSTSGTAAAPDLMIGLRVVAAIASAIALVWFALDTRSTVEDFTTLYDASAIQVIQLYTEGLFWMMLTIGLTISAYVLTRTTR